MQLFYKKTQKKTIPRKFFIVQIHLKANGLRLKTSSTKSKRKICRNYFTLYYLFFNQL